MDLLDYYASVVWTETWTFCGNALRVLVDGIMDAEVSAQMRRSSTGERSPERVTYRNGVPQPHLGYPGRHHGVAQSQADGKAATSPACWQPRAAQREG